MYIEGDRGRCPNSAAKSQLRSVARCLLFILPRSELSAAVAESTGVAPSRRGLLRPVLDADS